MIHQLWSAGTIFKPKTDSAGDILSGTDDVACDATRSALESAES